jgi:LmbE family N-acetylglucosaminyl deacetylase
MTRHKKILIIAAHPDDEVLGCGATIARLAKEGHKLCIAILGEGITSRYPNREDADISLIRQLQERSRQVAGLLGVTDHQLFSFPDNRFDSVPILDIVKTIEGLIENFQPDSIFTHHNSDLNQDHCIVSRATLIASRPVENTSVQSVISYEVPSSTEWTFHTIEPGFHPNLFFDVTETLDIKLQAMKMYDGEIRKFPHPRSPEALRSYACRWGSVSGISAAEAFEIIRTVQKLPGVA